METRGRRGTNDSTKRSSIKRNTSSGSQKVRTEEHLHGNSRPVGRGHGGSGPVRRGRNPPNWSILADIKVEFKVENLICFVASSSLHKKLNR